MKKIPKQKSICLTCQSVFFYPRWRKNVKCCSRKCRAKYMIGHKPFNWNGGIRKHKGYVYLLKKDHPSGDRDGYVLEHRYVMEQFLGRFLDSKEVIHHKNENRSDNRIENLHLVSSQGEHMKIHNPKGVSVFSGKHPWIGRKHSIKSRKRMSLSQRKRFNSEKKADQE